MEFKVRALDAEPKSVQEIEKVLLEKHEQEMNNETPENVVEQPQEVIPQQQPVELKEEDVLSYIGKRYNKQISSFDELMAERKESEQLPEDVAAYLKYKKETGRGFDDFLKLNKDYESMDSDDLLKNYLLSTQEGLDEDDVDVMMDEYRYDEDLDDESTVKKVKIAKKKVVAEAKKYFNTQKEKYKMPLESSGLSVSNEEREQYELYKQYLGEAKTAEEENNRKRGWFEQKTNEVFSGEFKGFEFNINDKKMAYAPSDAAELKKLQSNPSNFINKFLDENGLIKDAAGYHRSLAVAMNPEKFAKHFYEQGLADATDDVMRKTKNINMSERRAPEVTKANDGFQVRAVNPDSGRKLQIRSARKL
jgi:hypothetical protein